MRERWEHRFAQRRLSEFLDAELSWPQQQRVACHVEHCAECGRTLRALARVVDGLAALRRESYAPIGIALVEWLRAHWEQDDRLRVGRAR
jgi:hypothetical protein